MTTRYRKKPIEVDAIQWTGDNAEELAEFTGGQFHAAGNGRIIDDPRFNARVFDELHDTWVGVKTGQWVIKGVKGEFYPIDEQVLAETYEQVT